MEFFLTKTFPYFIVSRCNVSMLNILLSEKERFSLAGELTALLAVGEADGVVTFDSVGSVSLSYTQAVNHKHVTSIIIVFICFHKCSFRERQNNRAMRN
jgi:hypothetical protein